MEARDVEVLDVDPSQYLPAQHVHLTLQFALLLYRRLGIGFVTDLAPKCCSVQISLAFGFLHTVFLRSLFPYQSTELLIPRHVGKAPARELHHIQPISCVRPGMRRLTEVRTAHEKSTPKLTFELLFVGVQGRVVVLPL
jgi:hypothetical protein